MSNKIQEKPAMTDWRMQPTRSPPPSRDGELLKSPSHQQTKHGTGGQIILETASTLHHGGWNLRSPLQDVVFCKPCYGLLGVAFGRSSHQHS
jgi:hypothetical protein